MKPKQLLSIAQTATRLKVREEYVRELARKKRLDVIVEESIEGENFDAAQVEKLALLMDKLRQNGISTLVQITDKGENLH